MATKQMTVKDYTLVARNGRKIRVATMVILSDGTEIKFTERLSKRAAIRNAEYQLGSR
jgi:hypothetical protein